MSTNSLSVVPTITQTPAYSGVKLPDGQYLQAPQGSTPDDIHEYFKQNYPETDEYMQNINNKYCNRQLSEEELEKIKHAQIKSFYVKPKTAKKLLDTARKFIKKNWKSIKNFFKKLFPEKVDTEKIVDYADKGTTIYDFFDRIRPHKKDNPQDSQAVQV